MPKVEREMGGQYLEDSQQSNISKGNCNFLLRVSVCEVI